MIYTRSHATGPCFGCGYRILDLLFVKWYGASGYIELHTTCAEYLSSGLRSNARLIQSVTNSKDQQKDNLK